MIFANKRKNGENGLNMHHSFTVAALILVVAVTMTMIGCEAPEPEEEPEDIQAPFDRIDDGHNARNSLDYEGVYRGTLPAEDGEQVEVEIELHRDGTFVKRTIFSEEDDDDFETFATYTWNEEGNIITLQLFEQPEQYFVGENILINLDEDGEFRTGESAEDYYLHKEQELTE